MSKEQPTLFINPETPGYVGFANLPKSVHRKSVKKGFEFTLVVVGELGLGKSTLLNLILLTDLYPKRVLPGAQYSCMFARLLEGCLPHFTVPVPGNLIFFLTFDVLFCMKYLNIYISL
uniref:Septin-type G domain-containing protein n=1 Tax=Moschus moschiferus TaxID=68415 RepID=A0A8C6E3Z8_MOSMO